MQNKIYFSSEMLIYQYHYKTYNIASFDGKAGICNIENKRQEEKGNQ